MEWMIGGKTYLVLFVTLAVLTSCMPPCMAVDNISAIGTASEEVAIWTVMVFMNGDNNLEESAIDDLNEMEEAGSDENINIIALADRHPEYSDKSGNWTDTRLFYIEKDDDPYNVTSWNESYGELNMGDPNMLYDFINSTIEIFPAEHYMLVIWNHGNGWVVCGDDETNDDQLTIAELEMALSNISTKLDIIGFDECLMGQLEVAYQIAPHADIMIGSEETEPGWGWDYNSTLSALTNNPDMSAEELANQVLEDYESYCAQKGDNETITLSVVNLTMINGVVGTLDDLIWNINMNQTWKDIGKSRRYADNYNDRNYIDVFDFLDLLTLRDLDPTVKDKVDNTIEAINDTVINQIHGEGHPYAHGISIYFNKSGYSPDYEGIEFAKYSYWVAFLNAYYQNRSADVTPPEITSLSISSSVADINNPVEINATVAGDDIIDFSALVCGEEENQFVVMDSIRFEPEPFIEDGDTLSFIWDTYGAVIFNGTIEVYTPMEPITRDSNVYKAVGIYTDSETGEYYENAEMLFDTETGEFVKVQAYDEDGYSVPDIPKIGDTFTIYNFALTLDGEEIVSDFIISDSFFLYLKTYQLKLFDGFSYVSRTIGHPSTDKICKSAQKINRLIK